MYQCRRCKEIKPLELFPVNKSYKSGRATECRKCASARAYLYRSPIKTAMWKYSISEEQAIMYVSATKCEICGGKQVPGKHMCIDHCHTTGKVRGSLCDKCNAGLGYFKDSTELMDKAIKYLEKYDNTN